MQQHVINAFRSVVGDDGIITDPMQLRTYECDGLTNFRVIPAVVLIPASAEAVQGVVRICHRERIPFVARGAGTGLSGGALPVAEGVVISLTRLNRVLSVDLANGQVVVEPGVINAHVTQRV
ncbi:MAG TPA: FAD-binding protein, partial [Roseiflexaceae bacterium]|nr:FAD-binding protein [Roseiflexaceae bacterium]